MSQDDPREKQWLSIAEQASKETDAAKLSLLVEQLCAALDDERTKRLSVSSNADASEPRCDS
jgi:hypothetical protein